MHGYFSLGMLGTVRLDKSSLTCYFISEILLGECLKFHFYNLWLQFDFLETKSASVDDIIQFKKQDIQFKKKSSTHFSSMYTKK